MKQTHLLQLICIRNQVVFRYLNLKLNKQKLGLKFINLNIIPNSLALEVKNCLAYCNPVAINRFGNNHFVNNVIVLKENTKSTPHNF